MNQKIEDLYINRHEVVLPEINDYIKTLNSTSELFAKYIVGNLSDTDINLNVDTLRDYVEHSVWLYDNQRWENIPLDIFLNYIVNPRSSKEKVEACRAFFYKEVETLLQPSKLRTILDINYWCAAHVRYQLTDPRTKSAYFSYISGSGRCGEKATFLTQVYRSVGIPARSTYVPMWTHVDDNHAWVEIYIDGEWKYIGAGEGEEILEKAWFGLATSRASYLLSTNPTWIESDETFLESVNLWKVVDHTHHYTKTKTIKITSHIEGLKEVTLAVLNYGSFRPLTKVKLNDGYAEISFGSGDVVCRGVVGNQHVIRVIKHDETNITLTNNDIHEDVYTMTQNPGPAVLKTLPEETESMKVYKEAQRKKRQAEYGEKIKEINKNGMHHAAHIYLKNELGNRYELIMNALKPKDLQDIDPQLLLEHLKIVDKYKDAFEESIFYEYLATPRVYWEELTCYTEKFHKLFKDNKEWKEDPREIYTWVSQTINNDSKYAIMNTYMPIDRMIDYPFGSKIDANILTVAIARSIGIPSRYNTFKDDIEYYNGIEFESFTESKARHTLNITGLSDNVNVSINPLPEPSSFSVNIIEKDDSDTFSDQFNQGNYEVIVSQRLPSGTQHALVYPVNLDQDVSLTIDVPNIKFEDVIDQTQIEDILKEIGIETTFGIVVIGDAIEEPTAHALNEIMDRCIDINRLKIPVYFIDKNPDGGDALKMSTQSKIDNFTKITSVVKSKEDTLIRRVFREPGIYPFTSIFQDGKSRISNSGYRVGSIDNEWLVRIFEKEVM